MADIEFRTIASPPWRQNHVLHDARVSLEYRRILLLTCAHLPVHGTL